MRALLVYSAVLLAGISLAEDTPVVEADCKNGGVQRKDDKSKCDCQPYWDGVDCADKMCVNGGYTTPDGFCHCPKGYYGIHCDAVKLARPVRGVFSTDKTFNLYIHNELTDWYGMKALQRIKNETRAILEKNYKYDKFNLFVSKRAPIESTEVLWDFMQYTDRDVFLDALDGKEAKRTRTYSCANAEEISYKQLHDTLKDNGIEDSVILMFTQYPPKSDPDALLELKEYLRAFRIKLNVLIGADDILLDCNSKKNGKGAKFDELTDLVHFTDGEIATFLIEDDDSPDELLPSFIKASASPQSHSRKASDSCSIGLKFEFQTDPYPNTYYIAVRTEQDDDVVISGTCSSGGEVTALAASTYDEFTLSSILSGAQQKCEMVVTATGGCLATVYSVGGEKDVDKYDIFHSFATSEDMDSDSIHSFKNEDYFLTMHIDVSSGNPDELPKYQIVEFGGTVIVKNEVEQEVFSEPLVKRSSTFNYQSQRAFTCPENGTSWVQLDLEGFNINGDSVAVLNRIIHLNCEERKPAKVGTPKMLRLMEDATTNQLPTLALLYSNRLPTQQFSRFILESVDADVIEDKFSNYGYLRFDGRESLPFETTTNFQQFRKDVYDFAPDATITDQENLKQNLEKLTATPLAPESLVSIAIEHSMSKFDDLPSNLAALANLGARLLFVGDVDTVKIEEDSDTLDKFTRLAAASSGHLVLMDMDDFSDEPDENDDYPFYVATALRDLYSYGPSQRLLSYSNLEWEATPTTSQNSPIGTLQIPKDATEVFVSLTLNVEKPSDVLPAFMLSIVLEGMKDRIVMNIDDFTQYGTPGFVRSNLYTKKFTVEGGESYEGTFTVLAMTPFTGAHIRFWTARTEDDIIPNLKYVDFKEVAVQPDDYLGAALRVPDADGKTMSLRILDKNGIDATRLDHNQTVAVESGVAHFIPYFCNIEQTPEGESKDMYTIEITYESGFKYFRPMLCSKGKKAEKECSPQGPDGNSFCTESNPPFHRGPSKMLIDCSDAGQVVYTDAYNPNTYHYACVCDKGFAGDSCEQSSCEEGIEHLPVDTDAAFRTLSYVLLSPAGDAGCSNLVFYWEDAKRLFGSGSQYPNIWQYTFSVYFTDGTAKTLYRGPSFDEFYRTFDKIPTFDPETFCGSADNKTATDLNDVFNVAVESVGRTSRGVVLINAIQTFADDDAKFNELYQAFASDELYQSIQAYQQHIYMVTPTMTADFVSMTAASGGFAVRLQKDWDTEETAVKYAEILDGLLTSEIGWAGVTTEAKTRSGDNGWTIRKKGEVFVSSRPKKDGDAAPTVNLNGAAATTMDTFYVDKGDDDYHGSVSSHLSLDGTKSVIEIIFDKGTEYEFVQIVILTKDEPIRNALIGQSQANTDKHAAGATNSSEKAVHISFNKEASELLFEPADDNWRQAARINCSFSQEFVAHNQPFKTFGPSVVDFTVYPVADSASDFSLAVPLAVSTTIDCVHGTFNDEGSYCKCDSEDWSGPTCSQPSCDFPGTLNSHGDHCDCTSAQFGGPFCRDPNSAAEEY